MPTNAILYGKSLAFPPRVGADGRMVWSEGELNVRESICIILRTRPGERVNLPGFGCGLDRFLFEPNTTGTLRLIQEEVKRALSRWEPRIKLDDILVASDPLEPRAVNISIFYTLITTGQTDQLGVNLTLQG
jgi:phage baseplate assembly protein W